MIVWLTPSLIEGTANGNSTLKSSCNGLAPKALAASRTLPGTWRMPSSVSLIIEGKAKITVAITPGGLPIEEGNGGNEINEGRQCLHDVEHRLKGHGAAGSWRKGRQPEYQSQRR